MPGRRAIPGATVVMGTGSQVTERLALRGGSCVVMLDPLVNPAHMVRKPLTTNSSNVVFGRLAENLDRLQDGATPVLVVGPIDALAVTIASPQHVRRCAAWGPHRSASRQCPSG